MSPSGPRTAPRAVLRDAFDAALAGVAPDAVLSPHLPPPPAGRLAVLAVGKAALAMADAARRAYAAQGVDAAGVAVVPTGGAAVLPGFDVVEGDHPVPGHGSRRAADAAARLASDLGPDDALLVLVSGGGSALLAAPADGTDLSPARLAEVVDAVLRGGADVADLNAVRRALGRLAGGRLARLAAPARVHTRIVSDVVGDDPALIASGPTVARDDDAGRALAALARAGVAMADVERALRRMQAGEVPGPPAVGDLPHAADVQVVASGRHALDAAARTLAARGLPTEPLGEVTGDARAAGRAAARDVATRLARGEGPVVLLSGGEVTVTVRGDGRGGPSSTFALAFARALPPAAPVVALVADSDGIDGVGGHAGAFVEPGGLADLPADRVAAWDAADDTLAACDAAGATFAPGPTGVNVNDLRFVWLDPTGRFDA